MGVSEGSVARYPGVTSHCHSTAARGAVGPHGPDQRYVLLCILSGLYRFEYKKPIVSPNSPNEAFSTVFPFPRMSQATPARGTISFHVRLFVAATVCAGKMSLNWFAVVCCVG